jgi:butyrate kinase
LRGHIDAIFLTGRIVKSDYVVTYIKEAVGFLAPIKVYPGEFEMTALSLGAYAVLNGTEKLKEI